MQAVDGAYLYPAVQEGTVSDYAVLKQCIITTLTRRGNGTLENPCRIITEVWDAATGEKIAEHDPSKEASDGR